MCTKENPMWSEFGKAFCLVVGSHHFSSKGHRQFPHFRCQPPPVQIWAVTRWMYTGLNCSNCTQEDQQCTQAQVRTERHCPQRGVMVSAQRAAGRVFLLLPSHLTTCHWPSMPCPPQYLGYPVCTDWTLWPKNSSWHHVFFEKKKKYSNHILYVQTTDCVSRNLQIWVPFLLLWVF